MTHYFSTPPTICTTGWTDLEAWDSHIESLGILKRCRLNSNVESVRQLESGVFETIVSGLPADKGGGESHHRATTTYHSKNAVICCGCYDHNKIPSFASTLPRDRIRQHVTGGFKLADLVPGNILVVGAGQSGVQLSNVLCDHTSNRKVYLSVSNSVGAPRSFRGHDVFYWMHRGGILYMPRKALDNMPPEQRTALLRKKTPVSGPCSPMSPFSLERRGVEIVGRLEGVTLQNDDDGDSDSSNVVFRFQNNRCTSLQNLLDSYEGFRTKLHAVASGIENETGEAFPPETPEPEWTVTNPSLLTDPGSPSLDSTDDNITNIIWACGWDMDLSFLKVDRDPATNSDFSQLTGKPDVIVSNTYKGLFFGGFKWIGTHQSENIVNMDADARVILDNLVK